MKIETTIKGEHLTFDLDELASSHSGIITIGRRCNEVWNTIAIDAENVDPFQCHIIGGAGAPMRLNEGQERTECPKGLMSSKLVPCNGCMGRCVNIHPGRPKYYQRTPSVPTLINNEPVGEWGTIIKSGDTITIGDISLSLL